MIRENAYWVGIAEVSVVPSSGEVKVTTFTIGAEPGKIINPRQLDRCMKSGVVMGLSEALKEEVTFDKEQSDQHELEPVQNPDDGRTAGDKSGSDFAG